MKQFKGFPSAALVLLRDLKKHNSRPWFQAHRDIYQEMVRAPMLELIFSLGEAFRRFAPEMVADPRISLYRIYRDTRFSQDKSPYKTHIAAVFPVLGLPKTSGPGLYFHISAEEVLIGGGIYMPDPPALRAVREHISAQSRKFLAILKARDFRESFGELEGEKLKSMPRGFAADSAVAEYLRYKQFLFSRQFSPTLATNKRLLPTILRYFENGMPLIRFLKQPAIQSMSIAREALPLAATL